MRIAMIGHKRVPSREGGIEVVVEQLSTRLADRGNEIDVYNRRRKHVKNNKEKYYKGIRIRNIYTINKKHFDATIYSFFASIIAAFGMYDVIHYHAEGPCAMIWIPKLFRKKIVVTIHGLDWQRAKWKKLSSKYIKFGEKCAAKYADEIIVLSEETQKYFKDTYNRETRFIPNGVDKYEKEKPDIITKKYGLEEDSYILFLARIVPEKGVDYLIEAYEQINTDKKLVIAGGESHTINYFNYIKNRIKDNNNIIMTDFVEGKELKELFSNAYLYCLPSDVEGMPLTLLEAMSYGRNCLVSDIPENVQLIKDGTKIYGYTFEKGNVSDLKKQLSNILNTGKRIPQSEISNYIVSKYNWEKIVEETEKVYLNLLTKNKKSKKKLNGTVIVTYRCNAKCTMCNRYKEPSRPEEEITIETIKKLPKMYFTNITGGEPFIREDLSDIVRELYKKTDRIVISTNGFFTDRIIKLCEEFPNVGIRISIEGLEETNNEIRGLQDGFNRGYSTLKKLVEMKHPDVGFGMTVQDKNAKDLIKLYKLSDELNMEFATASLHNSFYFVEEKNIIHDRQMVAEEFEKLINELLNSKSPKKWFRAYFNHGLINYIYSQKRLLPCDMAFDTFFIDPYGDVMPCNGTEKKAIIGNLNEESWEMLWNSEQADRVRKQVKHCERNCWMIGSVSPAMHKYIWVPLWWVFKHKFLRFYKKDKYSMYENEVVRDYRNRKVSKEELDKQSTCKSFVI